MNDNQWAEDEIRRRNAQIDRQWAFYRQPIWRRPFALLPSEKQAVRQFTISLALYALVAFMLEWRGLVVFVGVVVMLAATIAIYNLMPHPEDETEWTEWEP
jgi:hypothetical protein